MPDIPSVTIARSQTLGVRLLIAFLSIALLPIVVIGIILVSSTLGQQKQLEDRLTIVAHSKQVQIGSWTTSLYVDLSRVLTGQAENEWADTLLTSDPASSEYTTSLRLLRDTLGQRLQQSQFNTLFLMDRRGRVALSTATDMEGQVFADQQLLQAGLIQATISPPQYMLDQQQAQMIVVRPFTNLDGQIIGVLAGRTTLKALMPIVQDFAGLGETGDAYLVDQSFNILLPTRYNRAGTPARSDAVTAALANTTGSGVYRNYLGVPVIGAYQLVSDLRVALVVEQNLSESTQATNATLVVNLSLALASAFIAVYLSMWITRSIATPLADLAGTVSQIAQGNLGLSAEVEREDEIAVVAQAINSMTGQLRGLIGSLETQVAARTTQLRASIEVGRAVASVLDPDQLLREVANLITDRFGFYYAAVFTLDSTGRFAELREATGEAGRILKERHHRLEVGGQSMVGAVTAQRKARIALDTGAEAVRFANPLLPATRSEIALPLMVGDRVLGALDVQSTQAAAFDENSSAVLQAMADQIAIALNNATSYAQAQTSAQRIGALYNVSQQLAHLEADLHALMRETLSMAGDSLGYTHWWIGTLDERGEWLTPLASTLTTASEPVRVSVQANDPIVRSAVSGEVQLNNDPPDDLQVAGTALDRRALLKFLTVPITSRDKVIGVLALGRPIDQPDLTLADVDTGRSIASLAAIGIENRRLFEQTRQARDELDALNRRLIGDTWQSYLQFKSSDRLVWLSTDAALPPVSSSEADQLATGQIAVRTGDGQADTDLHISVPILLRSQLIGAVRLRAPAKRWNNNLQALITSIAGHIAQAVENTRLLEQTQRTAQREKQIAQAADKIHRASDLEAVLRTAVAEVSRIVGVEDVGIQLGINSANGDSRQLASTSVEPLPEADTLALPQP